MRVGIAALPVEGPGVNLGGRVAGLDDAGVLPWLVGESEDAGAVAIVDEVIRVCDVVCTSEDTGTGVVGIDESEDAGVCASVDETIVADDIVSVTVTVAVSVSAGEGDSDTLGFPVGWMTLVLPSVGWADETGGSEEGTGGEEETVEEATAGASEEAGVAGPELGEGSRTTELEVGA